MNLQEQLLDLTQQALEELESSETLLSAVIRKAIRIARLRNDFYNVWWLEWEMFSMSDQEARNSLGVELISHFTKEQFEFLNNKYINLFVEERRASQFDRETFDLVDKGTSLTHGVPQIEEIIASFERAADEEKVPQGLPPLNLYSVSRSKDKIREIYRVSASQARIILNKITNRVHNFLISTEKQLLYGQIQSDIFERNREFVDSKLAQLCPDAIQKFSAIYKRLGESETDVEARSQALTSCRRILKDLADELYPPRKDPVIGADGKKRTLNDSMFVARLWQYVWERTEQNTSGKLLCTQVDDVGHRVDRLNDLSSKGVHDEVSKAEVDQCIIQTYLLCGDILRLSEEEN